MAKTYGPSLRLPKSGAQVCLRPGCRLTQEEVEGLDEYFLLLHPIEGPEGMDPDTGLSPSDDWHKD